MVPNESVNNTEENPGGFSKSSISNQAYAKG